MKPILSKSLLAVAALLGSAHFAGAQVYSTSLGAGNTNFGNFSLASGGYNAIYGGYGNHALGWSCTIGTGSFNFLTGLQNVTAGNFNFVAGASNQPAGAYNVFAGQNNRGTGSQNLVFGSFLDAGALNGSVILSDSNPFSIRTAGARFTNTTANSFTGIFDGGYAWRTNSGQVGMGIGANAGVFIKPNAANSATEGSPAFVGINTPMPNQALDVVGNGNFAGFATFSDGTVIQTVNIGADPGVRVTGGNFPFVTTGNGLQRFLGQAHGGTATAPTAATSGQLLVALHGAGHTGTGFSASRARIEMYAGEAWTDTANGTNMRFYTAQNGTSSVNERMRIADSGNVGIGTPIPAQRLHVSNGASGQATSIFIDAIIEDDEGAYLQINSPAATEAGVFMSRDGNPFFAGLILSISDLLEFRQNGGTQMSITTNGLVGMGRTATTNKLEVEGNASKTTATAWLANSDRRIKTDVEELNGADALRKMRAVRPVAFQYTPDYKAAHPSIENRTYVNVIAQEFAEVFPESVQSSGEKLPGTDESAGSGNEILQVDTYPLTIYSAAAIKELDARSSELRKKTDAQIAERDARIDELEARLARLEKLFRSAK